MPIRPPSGVFDPVVETEPVADTCADEEVPSMNNQLKQVNARLKTMEENAANAASGATQNAVQTLAGLTATGIASSVAAYIASPYILALLASAAGGLAAAQAVFSLLLADPISQIYQQANALLALTTNLTKPFFASLPIPPTGLPAAVQNLIDSGEGEATCNTKTMHFGGP